MPDYQKGKIYILSNATNSIIYIGSTIQRYLSQRMGIHRDRARKGIERSPLYIAMQMLGPDTFTIALVKNFPCNSKDELEKEEYQVLADYIKVGTSVYNSKKDGKHSAETKQRIAETNRAVVKRGNNSPNFKFGTLGSYQDRGTTKWMFTYRIDGKLASKSFACKKYGFWQAKKLAEAARHEVYPEWHPDPEEDVIDSFMAIELD